LLEFGSKLLLTEGEGLPHFRLSLPRLTLNAGRTQRRGGRLLTKMTLTMLAVAACAGCPEIMQRCHDGDANGCCLGNKRRGEQMPMLHMHHIGVDRCQVTAEKLFHVRIVLLDLLLSPLRRERAYVSRHADASVFGDEQGRVLRILMGAGKDETPMPAFL
jgi:hypothetical protein